MWGTQAAGGSACADDAKITGYVFMYEELNAALGGTANCVLTTNAKTQWAFSTQALNADQTAAASYSVVILNGAEEGNCGGYNDATCGSWADPIYYGVGGSSSNGKSASLQDAFGLGTYNIHIVLIDGAGEVVHTDYTGVNASTEWFHFNDRAITKEATGATEEIYVQHSATAYLNIGNFITNSCLTAFAPFYNADDT